MANNNKIELLSSTYHEALGSTGKPKFYRTGVVKLTTPSGWEGYWAVFNWGAGKADWDGQWSSGQVQVDGPYGAMTAALGKANKKVASKVNGGYVAVPTSHVGNTPTGIAYQNELRWYTDPNTVPPDPDPLGAPRREPSVVLTAEGFKKPMDQLAKDFNLGVTAALRMSDVGDMLTQRRDLIDVYEHFKSTAASIDAAMEMLDVAVRSKLSA